MMTTRPRRAMMFESLRSLDERIAPAFVFTHPIVHPTILHPPIAHPVTPPKPVDVGGIIAYPYGPVLR